MRRKLYIVTALMMILANSCTKYTEYEFYDYKTPYNVDFEYSIHPDGTVQFKNITTGPIESVHYMNSYGALDTVATTSANVKWLWDFGDNNKSTSYSPTHTYSQNGNYTVKLTIEADNNKKNITEKSYSITIVNVFDYITFTDNRDGQSYKSVTIGDQVWMAENLNYEGSGSRVYNNSSSNAYIFGRLYNWEAACEACPDGWHLPDDGEWYKLTNYLGGYAVAGGKMKEVSTRYWRSPNKGATNESGFSALPGGGWFNVFGIDYSDLGVRAGFWSASEKSSTHAWSRNLDYSHAHLDRYNNGNPKHYSYSVRCVKD